MDDDSDSDWMSSDMRLLRRSLGLSASAKKRPAAERPAHSTGAIEQQPQTALDRPSLQMPEHRPQTVLNQPSVEMPEPRPHRATQPAQPSQPVHRPVTPGEITALLSPHKRLTKKPRPPSKPTTPIATPQRTPESRMASLWDDLDASPWNKPRATPLSRRRTPLASPTVQRASGPLGSVEDALVTPEDLERAERKLGASVALTQQQMLDDLRRRLVGFAGQLRQPPEMEAGREATLLCQFHTMGHGRVALGDEGVGWQGAMLGPLGAADSPGDSAPTQPAVLLFPWRRVTAARRKHVDGRELLLLTVDEDLGLGFFCPQATASTVDALAARALALQSAERAKTAEALRAANHQEAAALVHRLLALATDATPEDVQRMATDEFLEDALPMVRRLAAELADMARPPEDVTETLPGTCTLCYAAPEAHELRPCGHRLCSACLDRLQTPGHPLACPWDRTATTGCMPT
ncbi:hypothetical protein GGI15_003493 [Coemansia interrupta]|uniref:RING-type domain-containing protein n=1 Tax=Coemansia interrupta TaxID=1126814 RepID=A0A9W8LGE4_9FUNG|nr:hypothetical protein GGI15_003493 [Coemansia interrupta]